MSFFKPFTTSDISTTPFKLNKTFSYESLTEITGSGIDIFIGTNTPPTLFAPNTNLTGYITQQNTYLVYKSIEHLYYSNFTENLDGNPAELIIFNTDNTIVGGENTTNYQNYLTTTLPPHRTFPTGSGNQIGVISIPSNIFGEYITPNTFILESSDGVIEDDGEGRLYNSGSLVGNIIYEHGICILNLISLPPQNILNTYTQFIENPTLLSFKSSLTIYETQYKCTIRENEFNLTHNPTVITGSISEGNLKPYITEGHFSPFVTSIGLHNNDGELIAIAKLSQPLPTSPTTDTNIIVNLDL